MADVNEPLQSIIDPEGIWMSQYDYPRRTITVTRVHESVVRDGRWVLSSLVRVDELSDPGGRFEVFVESADDTYGSGYPAGTIMKVVARLNKAGYLAAWHPDFEGDLMLCQPTIWGEVIYGDVRERLTGESRLGVYWTYASRGHIARTENPRTWTEAYSE